MKSFRWTLVAVATVAALAVFTIYDYKRSEQSKEATEKATGILKLSRDAISRIEIVNRMGSIVLEKKGDVWDLTAPVKDRADLQAVDSFLDSVDNEKTTATVVEGDNIQLDTFGLANPMTRLKLQDSKGKNQEIKIGSVKAFDGNLYAQLDSEQKVYLVTQSWDPLLAKAPGDLRDKHLLRTDFKIDDLVKIEFKSPNFTLEKKDSHWKITKGAADLPLVDDFVSQFVDKLKGARGLAIHALEPIKSQFEVTLFNKDKSFFHAALGEEKKANRGAATVEAQSSDYKEGLTLTSAVADSVRRTPQDFYDKKVPFRFKAADVGRVEIDSAALKSTFVKKGDIWESADPGLQKRLDSSKLNELIKKLGSVEAVRILEPFKAKPKLKNQSRIALFKAEGKEPIFEFAWGDVVVEKAAANRPEARYHLAWTNKANANLGVSEGEVKGLGLETLLTPNSTTSPAPPPK